MHAKRFASALALSLTLVACGGSDDARSQSENVEEAQPATDLTLATLAEMEEEQLDAIFARASAGDRIPDGESDGVAIFFGGTSLIGNFLANRLWAGKYFAVTDDGQSGSLFNKLLLGGDAPAKLSFATEDETNCEGDPSCDRHHILLDYSNSTDWRVRHIVDRLRLVEGSDSLYLGRAYIFGRFLCYFALDFDQSSRPAGVQQDDSQLTISGVRFEEDSTLAGVQDEFPDLQQDYLARRFFEFTDGEQSAVVTTNPTDVELASHVYVVDSSVVAQLNGGDAKDVQLQISGELGTELADGRVELRSATLAIAERDEEATD